MTHKPLPHHIRRRSLPSLPSHRRTIRSRPIRVGQPERRSSFRIILRSEGLEEELERGEGGF
jgi:hypothetical protein